MLSRPGKQIKAKMSPSHGNVSSRKRRNYFLPPGFSFEAADYAEQHPVFFTADTSSLVPILIV